jgi:hypothetical protein
MAHVEVLQLPEISRQMLFRLRFSHLVGKASKYLSVEHITSWHCGETRRRVRVLLKL